MTTQSPLSGPMTVGDLLDRAFRLYRARFGLFLLTAALLLAPAAIIYAVFVTVEGGKSGPFLLPGVISYVFGLLSYEPTPEQMGFAHSFVIILATALAIISAVLALTIQSDETLYNRPIVAWEILHRSLDNLWQLVGMTMIKWSAVIAATAVVFVPVLFGHAYLSLGVYHSLRMGHFEVSSVAETVIEAAVYIGYAVLLTLLVFPSVYLLSRWLVAPAALVVEGLEPISSLRRSWQLSRNNVRRIAGYGLLLGLLMFVLPLTIQSVLGWIFGLVLSAGASDLLLHFPTAFSFLYVIIGTPFSVSMAVLLYYDLRIRNEGYDLELRVAELEEQVSRDLVKELP